MAHSFIKFVVSSYCNTDLNFIWSAKYLFLLGSRKCSSRNILNASMVIRVKVITPNILFQNDMRTLDSSVSTVTWLGTGRSRNKGCFRCRVKRVFSPPRHSDQVHTASIQQVTDGYFSGRYRGLGVKLTKIKKKKLKISLSRQYRVQSLLSSSTDQTFFKTLNLLDLSNKQTNQLTIAN
jgi:hypothetical protein